jgi:(S)-ureidoglycine aminohydrolase
MTHLGQTRACQRANHLLVTPDTFIRAPLPGMRRATAIVHAAPRLGARFLQYSAEFEKDGEVGHTTMQRFVYVLDGTLRITFDEAPSDLHPGEYVYFPAYSSHSLVALEPARAVIIEKPYNHLVGELAPRFASGVAAQVAAQPLLGDPSVEVRPLIPESRSYDFAVNAMTFEPGASLPIVESHIMEHGLFMLAGGGIYRLGDCWHPVAAGDFIYMAPYCPQWFCAVGKTPARYLIYKDWNRHAD